MECGTHLDAWQDDDAIEPELGDAEEAVAEDDPTLVVTEPAKDEAARSPRRTSPQRHTTCAKAMPPNKPPRRTVRRTCPNFRTTESPRAST